jgi:dTDP-4-dehydrorhamnose reductase
MKILLFGGSGQLGYDIQVRAHDLNFDVVSPVISEVNISERKQVEYLASELKPDLIVNCAAYTAVDKAEVEKEEAYSINCLGAKHVALAAKKSSSRLIHISTDYVFAGDSQIPLNEEMPTSPLNVYGQSKLDGEVEILKNYPEHSLILRTASLYGQRGVNFVRTMLELFRTKSEVKVVEDQVMSPTWSGWLAEAILDLGRMDHAGIMHATCSGHTTWFDFACSIRKNATMLETTMLEASPDLKITPILAKDFARPARRPQFSVLDCSKLTKALGRAPMPWEDALKAHLKEIGMRGE